MPSNNFCNIDVAFNKLLSSSSLNKEIVEKIFDEEMAKKINNLEKEHSVLRALFSDIMKQNVYLLENKDGFYELDYSSTNFVPTNYRLKKGMAYLLRLDYFGFLCISIISTNLLTLLISKP